MDNCEKMEIEESNQNEVIKCKIKTKLGIRHVQVFLLFLLLFIAYALRVNMSVAIVAMVDKNSISNFQKFNWNSSIQSIVLSSFFWGYVMAQIPAGPMAQKYGAKIILVIALSLCSFLTLITPFCANYGGWGLVCFVRLLQGLTQSFVFPCTHTLLSKWAPLSERGRLATFCYAGSQLGTVFMLAISGLIAYSPMGWPGIFYFSGIIGILWAIGFTIFGSNSPADHKNITQIEREFIEESTRNNENNKSQGMSIKIPWHDIFTSTPFWALLIVHCGQNWGFWTLLTNTPTYMRNMLEYDIKSNALLSAFPYLMSWICSLFVSSLADYLINKKITSVATNRKLFNSIGHWVPMLMMIGLGYISKENREYAIILLTISVACNSGTFCGFLINHMDLSPNFAGTLMGLTNFAANIISIIAPLVVGLITVNENDLLQWRIVFFIAASVYFFGNLVFIIFGKASIQKWNDGRIIENKV